MRKRMWSACALICALLLLLSTASLAKSVSDVRDPGARARIGVGTGDPPRLNTGTDPGDDDTPDRGGEGGVDQPAGRGTIAQAASQPRWSLKDRWASFRLQVLTVLRVWK